MSLYRDIKLDVGIKKFFPNIVTFSKYINISKMYNIHGNRHFYMTKEKYLLKVVKI